MLSLTYIATTIAPTRVSSLATTHSVVPLAHTTIHLLKDVLTMLNKLLEFVLELHHFLIHNL
jgi:hypothetical protein